MRKEYLRNFSAGYLATSSIVLAPFFVSAQVVVSEVAFDPIGSDDKREWIEIHNLGTSRIDLSKWSFSDGGTTRHALNLPPKNGGRGSVSIAPGGFLIIADDAAMFAKTYPEVSDIIDSAMNLKNPASGGSVSIVLYDEHKQVADTFTYAGGMTAKGSGDSAQRFGTTVMAGPPTPGAENQKTPARMPVQAAVPKSAPQTVARATPSKKAKSTPTVRKPPKAAADPQEASISDERPGAPMMTGETAAAADGSFSRVWYAGALGLAGLGGLAAYAARRFGHDEWEIEDMGETV